MNRKEYKKYLTKKKERLFKLTLKEDGDLVEDVEEVENRMKEMFDVEIKEKNGTKIYCPPYKQGHESKDFRETIVLPVHDSIRVVKTGEHPSNVIGNIEEEVEKHMEYEKSIKDKLPTSEDTN